jgi:outer membrane protein assembly factor BamD (BamD/ComL family)
MLDNKLCGDWLAESKCPEMESQLYEKHVAEHPQSPKAAEALYLAAWRQSALIEIYKTENNAGRSAAARSKALALAQRVASQYPQSEWAPRAVRLAYMVEQNIPTYGSALE